MTVALAGRVLADPASDNTGVADTGPSTYQPPTSLSASWQAKQLVMRNMMAGRPATQGVSAKYMPPLAPRTNLSTATSTSTCTINGYACYYALTPTIYWEGENNGNAWWTCGPASTRNLVKTRLGTDYGENQFAVWEGTTTQNGTYIGNITATLNNHFSNIDTFGLFHETTANNLLIDTQAIVGEYGHEYIQNVRTDKLWFWNGHRADHYDGVFGWHNQSVYVSEEWYPAKIGITSSYGQPYGERNISTAADLTAINYSPTTQFTG